MTGPGPATAAGGVVGAGDRETLEDLVEKARSGDHDALEALVRALQDDVYGLALRMLWHPEDAEDACQEILLRIVTRLDSFRNESAFRTWAWRVAANHLLTTRRRRMERPELSFDAFGDELAVGLADGELSDGELGAMYEGEHAVLVEEVKIGCSQAMLLCLDRPHRLAYVLGEILEMSGPEAADVLDISRAAFRKRLQRARERVEGFVREHCGLVSSDAACRCGRRVERAVDLGRVDPDALLFAGTAARAGWVSEEVALARRGMHEVERLRSAAALLRSNPRHRSPRDHASAVRRMLEPDRSPVLNRPEGRTLCRRRG